ncbi:hypothetical protein K438DRAFT_2032836 [Mycena galopus ATCC 62051]|nr:hypothetical protein K438DRAFT_2032836 [Mycena galopus ATCC 62051]
MSLPTFSSTSTGEETAAALAGEIQGKNVLITGTSMGGLGFEIARVIAKHANLVIISGYNLERLKLSKEAIKKDTPTANIRTLVLDLSSFAAVRKAAAEVNAYSEPLHVLIHNAAAPVGPFKLTVDNLESQTATDYIGPFLFTKLLAPKLLAAGTSSYVPRVVYMSSTGHGFIPELDLNTIVGKPDPATYHAFNAYSHAKAANVLAAIELSKRSGGRINAYSLCPGLIYTNIHQKPESFQIMQEAGFIDADGKPSTEKYDVWKPMSHGSTVTIVAAFDPRFSDHPGAYLANGEANKERAAHSSDPVTAEKLWTQTEDIIGEKFTI